MLYATTALLSSRGLWRSKHQGIIAAFGEYFIKPGLIEPEFGRMLNEAFQARLDSDYIPYPNPDWQSAQQLVEKARIFVERVGQYLAEANTDREVNDANR